MTEKSKHLKHQSCFKYLKSGLATISYLALIQGLAYAGFEEDVKGMAGSVLGEPLHYIMAVVYGYAAIPHFKDCNYKPCIGMAILAVGVDIVVLQLTGGGLGKWITGAAS